MTVSLSRLNGAFKWINQSFIFAGWFGDRDSWMEAQTPQLLLVGEIQVSD